MAIEFLCPDCYRFLRVSDDAGGKSCRCPGCGSEVVIPTLTISSTPEKESPASESPSQSEIDVDSHSIQNIVVSSQPVAHCKLLLHCPQCEEPLLGDRSVAGTRGRCPKCSCIFQISDDGRSAICSVQMEFVFSCPSCRQFFEGHREMINRRGKCANCGHVFMIFPNAEEARLGSTHQENDVTKIVCTECSSILKVLREAIGHTVQCPNCLKHFVVNQSVHL